MKVASRVISESDVQFGTSGARGLVKDFKDEVCAAFTISFLNIMREEFVFNRVAVAMDNRPSSPGIAVSICGAAKAYGLEVDFYGVMPTPGLAFQAMNDLVPSIMITGSHIPFDRNGIKFYRPDGEITKSDEEAILNSRIELIPTQHFLPEVSKVAAVNYMKRYSEYFGSKALEGLKLGVYEHSSSGRDLYRELLTVLGAEVVTLGRSNEFVPIDTEAVSEQDQEKAFAWSAKYKLDAIFSTDGDGDRPLIADEKGQWLRGDVVGLLTSKILEVEALAVPVSCNTSIERSGLFKKIKRTKIGSPFIIEAFPELDRDYSSIAGFEANGGGYLVQI